MAEQDLIQLARDNIDAFNAADWSRMRDLFAPGSVYDELGTQRRLEGADQTIETMQGWKQAFPDAQGTVTSAIASGNNVVIEIRWEGTHTGPLQSPTGPIPASGKRQVTPAVMVLDFEGDKIRESRHYFDSLTLLQQIGAVPAQEQAQT